MKISEKNLFDFIFSPKSLSLEMKTFIELNQAKYVDELQLLKDIYEETIKNNEPIPDEKIDSAIFFSVPSTSIVLNRIVPPAQAEWNGFVLAAKSIDSSEDRISTETFADENSDYFLKIITKNKLSKIYLFEKNQKLLEKIRLTLLPSKFVIDIENNSKAHSVSNLELPDSVIIDFGFG